jgi:hypothetical protein
MAVGSFASGGLGMGVVFSLKDEFSSSAGEIQREMKKLDSATDGAAKSITTSLNMVKAGFASAAAGAGILAMFAIGAAQFAKWMTHYRTLKNRLVSLGLSWYSLRILYSH